ncbi:hypothetical protein ACQ4PT_017307 [Festuca glaucescens]
MSVDVAGAEKKKKPLLAEGLLLPASMVLVQAFTIGAFLLSKVAFNIGMAPFVLLAYRNLIGSITVPPSAFYFERLEKLKIATCPGKMKVVGTLQAVGGVSSVPDHHNMLIGTLFLAGSSLSYAFWFIIQARVSKEFPSKYFSTMLACVSGTVQAMVIGVILNHDPSAWAVKWDLQLLTVVYSGVFNTAVTFCLISWAVARRGLTYPSMFNSVALIFTMILDSVLLGTDVSVGSLLGAILIIVGLYAFLWGERERGLAASIRSCDPILANSRCSSMLHQCRLDGRHKVTVHPEKGTQSSSSDARKSGCKRCGTSRYAASPPRKIYPQNAAGLTALLPAG